MARHPLHDLVRRRLWELDRSPDDASWRSGWVFPAEALQRMARGRGRSWISEGLAVHLARALDVPENRVRRAAGLPLVDDPEASIRTGPHLRLVKDGEPLPQRRSPGRSHPPAGAGDETPDCRQPAERVQQPADSDEQ